MLRPAIAIVVLLLAAALPAATAVAQDDPSASEVALAREQFRLGVSAAREERWEEARDAFQRSYELAPRPLTLLNLGGALVQTGMLVEGAEAYRRFLREVRTGRPARQRGAARAALEAAEARLARVRIDVQGVSRGDVIRVDGEEISLSALELELPVNPGERVLEIERNGETVVRREVQLAEGESREVTLTVPPGAGGREGGGEGPEPGGEGEPSLLESPWVWVGAGAAVVAIVIVVVLLASGGTEDPYSGNVPPGTWVVR